MELYIKNHGVQFQVETNQAGVKRYSMELFSEFIFMIKMSTFSIPFFSSSMYQSEKTMGARAMVQIAGCLPTCTKLGRTTI